jgi:uncharacterized membrane protein YdjX (TVP38/TMEM64 family)
MTKMKGIIKEFKIGLQENLLMGLAFVWVSVVPSLGTLVSIPILLNSYDSIRVFSMGGWLESCLILMVLTGLMGLALVPTTIVAVFSGFLFDWQFFPLLVVAYALASILGYFWGSIVTKDGLDFLFKRYPKTKHIIDTRKKNIPEVVFFLRISPIIPFAFSNLLFAFLQTGIQKLLVWGTLGMLPRTTLAFYTGTIASDLYAAFHQGNSTYQAPLFILLLLVSSWGLWKVFTNTKEKKSPQ